MLNKMIRKVWICLVECGNDGSEKQMNRNILDLNDSKYEKVTVLSEFLSVLKENKNLLRLCDVDELETTYRDRDPSQSTAINEFCGSSEEDPLYIYFPKNYGVMYIVSFCCCKICHSFFLFLLTETMTDYITKKEHDANLVKLKNNGKLHIVFS